jgi:hypothetical protein
MDASALGAFLKKVAENEGLRKELAELAGRYGVPLGTDELNDEALNQVAGGLLPAIGLSSTQTRLTGDISSVTGKKVKSALEIGTLGDGSV